MKAAAAALAAVCGASGALAAPLGARGACHTSVILEPSPFMGSGGEILVLVDGSIWKDVSYQSLALYAYQPSVLICLADGTMVLGRNVFRIIPATR